MGLMDRFLCRRETEFAEKLAEKIHRQMPPTSEVSGGKKGKQRPETVLEKMMQDIDAFRTESRPGWIGTARLGNTLRWSLLDLGYSKPFVEELTGVVIKRMMLK